MYKKKNLVEMVRNGLLRPDLIEYTGASKLSFQPKVGMVVRHNLGRVHYGFNSNGGLNEFGIVLENHSMLWVQCLDGYCAPITSEAVLEFIC
jgi:hypothetical protein